MKKGSLKKKFFKKSKKKATVSKHRPASSKAFIKEKKSFSKPKTQAVEEKTEKITYVDLERLLQSNFSEEVLREAEKFPSYLHTKVIEKEIQKGRRDLRSLETFTIDGLDAKDLDDALSIQKEEGGYRLWVHIADVSHYVQENSALDKEAMERTTSTYLPQKVIPMLPSALSNGLCSLHPKKNRLSLTAELFLDEEGHLVDGEVYESIICSDLRMDYETVYLILENKKKTPKAYKPFLTSLRILKKLASLRKEIAQKRGCFSFSLPELKVLLNEKEEVLDVYPYQTNEANEIIEECMILANTFVSKFFEEKKLPFLYRVHEEPNSEKLREFAKIAHWFSVHVKEESPKNQKYWANLSRHFQEQKKKSGKTEYDALSTLLLRSMAKARYAEEPLGHYGLGLRHYSHFTSPIRRYPDLFIHRVIKQFLHKQRVPKLWYAQSEFLATQCSAGEKRAVSFERLAIERKCAEYMQQKLGEVYEAKVTGFCPAGCFLALENGIEGMLPFASLPFYMYYEEERMQAVSRRGELCIKMGSVWTVQVVRVNIERGQIDFALHEDCLKDLGISSTKGQKRTKRRARK